VDGIVGTRVRSGLGLDAAMQIIDAGLDLREVVVEMLAGILGLGMREACVVE
jgi:hypothetical protein